MLTQRDRARLQLNRGPAMPCRHRSASSTSADGAGLSGSGEYANSVAPEQVLRERNPASRYFLSSPPRCTFGSMNAERVSAGLLTRWPSVARTGELTGVERKAAMGPPPVHLPDRTLRCARWRPAEHRPQGLRARARGQIATEQPTSWAFAAWAVPGFTREHLFGYPGGATRASVELTRSTLR